MSNSQTEDVRRLVNMDLVSDNTQDKNILSKLTKIIVVISQ